MIMVHVHVILINFAAKGTDVDGHVPLAHDERSRACYSTRSDMPTGSKSQLPDA